MNLREEQKLFKQAQKIAKKFIGLEGVNDIEFGLKHQNGELVDEISLRFKVNEKKTESKLKKSEVIPKKIDGFTTDVLKDITYHHHLKSVNPRNNIRPIIGGIQIQSHIYNGTSSWGTMGCIYSIQDYIIGLTNYHVLYGGTSPEMVLNEYINKMPVFQNLCHKDNQIGIASNLFNFDLDYASFIIQVPYDELQSINSINGLLTSYSMPCTNRKVFKSGARTGVTYGIIDARSCIIPSDLSIYIDTEYQNSNNVISDYGDSGSIWILNDNTNILKPVGLHFAGGENTQWAKAKAFTSIFASMRNKIKNQNLIS